MLIVHDYPMGFVDSDQAIGEDEARFGGCRIVFTAEHALDKGFLRWNGTVHFEGSHSLRIPIQLRLARAHGGQAGCHWAYSANNLDLYGQNFHLLL